MKLIIIAVLNITTVAAGVIVGGMLRSSDSAPAAPVAEESESDHPAGSPNEKGKGGDAATASAAVVGDTVYSLRFARPLVVPVTDGWRTTSLVVVNMGIEFDKDAVEGIPALENRVRDRVMAGLMSYSHDGGFNGAITDPVVYDGVRLATRDALTPTFGDGVGDVQILEMVKRGL